MLAMTLAACALGILFQEGAAPASDQGAAGKTATAAPAAASALRPTLEEIFSPPRIGGVRPDDPAISADGRFVTYRWAEKDADKVELDTWVAAADGSGARKLFAASEHARIWWLKTGARLLVQRDGWLELHDLGAGAPPLPLAQVGDGFVQVHRFDDGRRVAFSGGEPVQLWVLDLESGERTTPADALKNRSGWFDVLEECGRVALFADRSGPSPEKNADKPGAPSEKPSEKPPEKKDGTAREVRGDRFAQFSIPEKADKAEKPDKPDAAKRVLWLVPLDGGDAVETTLEEGRPIELSADGRFALGREIKSDDPRKLILADYLSEQVTAVPVRSSLAGDRPAAQSIELYDVEARKSFDPRPDAGSRFWEYGARWSKTGSRLLLERVTDDDKVRQILLLDPATRASRLVFAERDDAWIGGPTTFADFGANPDQVLFTSERSGFNQLYRYDASTGETQCLTDESRHAEVAAVVREEDGAHAVVAVHAASDPAEIALERVDVVRGERVRVSAGGGVASKAAMAVDGAHACWLQSFPGTPAEVYCAAIGGEPRALTSTATAAHRELALGAPEIVEFENPADHVKVRALLYKPPGFDPAVKHPAVVFIHGAGYLQNVLRSLTSYEPNWYFHQRLARKGYVVLDPDYRHSAGYGRTFRTDIYGFMGGKDLDDVVAGVEWLQKNAAVDGARVGIYGGSYGGFMTLMALFTKPKVFACGCALRSVSDWRTYNSGYTTPRLGDPKKDAENYVRSSPIDHVDGLERPLLLLHGLKDSNVFAQDTIRLMEALIEKRKDFEVMLYPSQDHAFTDPESWLDEYRRIERFFDRYLQPPATPDR